jgi:hypothetical protein
MQKRAHLAFAAAITISALPGSALGQGVDIGIGLTLPLAAPGQAGTSPGQDFITRRSDLTSGLPNTGPTAPSPGQLFILNREAGLGAAPPGHMFTAPGQSVTNHGSTVNNARAKK